MPPRCKKASFANHGFIPFASETAWKGPPCPRPGLAEAERACTGHCVIPTAIDTGCLGGHCWLHGCVPMTRGQDLSWVQSGQGRGQRGEQKAAFWPPSTCFQHLRTALRLCSSRVSFSKAFGPPNLSQRQVLQGWQTCSAKSPSPLSLETHWCPTAAMSTPQTREQCRSRWGTSG